MQTEKYKLVYKMEGFWISYLGTVIQNLGLRKHTHFRKRMSKPVIQE